jgi:hypothetical protein
MRFDEKTVRTLAAYAQQATGGRVALGDVVRPGDGRTYFCEAKQHRVWTAGREAAAYFLGAAFTARRQWPAPVREAYEALQSCTQSTGLSKAFHTGQAVTR